MPLFSVSGIEIPALPVFVERVEFSQLLLGLLVLVGEIVLPTGAEIDVPAPESSQKRFGIIVICGPELAVFARVLCHKNESLFVYGIKIRKYP